MVRTFETYSEAKKHFSTLTLGGNTCFGYKNDKGVAPDTDKFHDVMLCMYMSDFIYSVGILRTRTRDKGCTLKSLKEELPYFFGEYKDNDKLDGLARLLSGRFKVKDEDKDGLPDPPNFDFNDLEAIIQDPKFDKFTTPEFIARSANDLTVAAIESFKCTNLFLYKFDAKFDKMHLVYAIAVRKKGRYNDLILTFRGSSTYRDWWQNIQAPLTTIDLHRVGDKAYFVEGSNHNRIEIDIGLYKKLEEALLLEDTVDGQHNKRIPIRVHRGKFRLFVRLPPRRCSSTTESICQL
jgi:hypothetical protein